MAHILEGNKHFIGRWHLSLVSKVLYFAKRMSSSQSRSRPPYKASTIVNYDSRAISISNLLVIMTLES